MSVGRPGRVDARRETRCLLKEAGLAQRAEKDLLRWGESFLHVVCRIEVVSLLR